MAKPKTSHPLHVIEALEESNKLLRKALEDAEFRFWFTRRVTLFILAATSHLLVKNLEQTHSPEAAKAIAEFEEEAVKADRQQKLSAKADAYEPAGTYPLGADPLLVMDVKCAFEKQGDEDLLSLDLVLPGGANINLKMAGPTLQAMCLLLNQLREHAAWGDVPQVQEVATTGKSSDGDKKPLMH